MQIRKINTETSKDIQQFIRFPFDLYKGCSQWVPPLISEMRLVLNRKKHPFYQHSDADFFVIESEHDVLGRIAVLHNRNYCQFRNEKTAFFYYFDCIEDIQISRSLFQVAFDWAAQRGLTKILGPKGFLRSSGMGILVKGFEFLPAVGIPYNFPYYEKFVLDSGFTKALDHLSGYMTIDQKIPQRLHLAAEKIRAKGTYWVKTFKNKAEMRAIIPAVKKIQEEAFLDNPNYFPSTDDEFKIIANNLIQVADPRLIKIIMKGDDAVGFIISYADISKALQKCRGELFPLGWLTVLRELRTTDTVDLNGIGLLPQYQGIGGNILLYAELDNSLRQFQFKRGEFIQVNENNFKSKSDWENLGVIFHKLHRTYSRTL